MCSAACGQWDQIPEIKSAAEYQRYVETERKLREEFNADLPPRNDPRGGTEWAQKMRTPEGMLLTAIGARIIEWEGSPDNGDGA